MDMWGVGFTPPRHRQRTTDTQPCWRCRAAAQEPLPRRDHPHRDVTPGAHAAPGRACPPSKAASHPLPWRPRAPCQAASRDHSILWAPSRPHPWAWHSWAWAWHPERAGQHEYPLSRPRRGAPCRGAGAPELGPVAQAGIRDRHRAVPAVRRHLEAHRRHRRSPRDRQDPHAPRLVRPGTAPIARAAIRPIPNGLLIPGRAPPGSTPRADSLLWPALAREAKTPRIRAPRTDESPDKSSILDRPLAPLTTHRSIRTLPPSEKGRLKFLARSEIGVTDVAPVVPSTLRNTWRRRSRAGKRPSSPAGFRLTSSRPPSTGLQWP